MGNRETARPSSSRVVSRQPVQERENSMATQRRKPKRDRSALTLNETVTQPNPAEIAKRAHELYLARGGAHGYDLDDWLQAERELKARSGKGKRPGRKPIN